MLRRSFAFVALVVACNSSSSPRVAGTVNYDLATIDGQALPAASGSNLVVRGGATLDGCGRFVLSEVDTVASSTSSTSQVVDGTWTMKGDSIRLTTRVSQATYTGTLIASELTRARRIARRSLGVPPALRQIATSCVSIPTSKPMLRAVTLRSLIVLLLLAPALSAQIPHPLVSRHASGNFHSVLITRADTADKHSLKPLMIGAVLGGAVGLYFGELARGSCERPGCTERYEAAPYIGLGGGAIVGALAGELFAHLPRGGPR